MLEGNSVTLGKLGYVDTRGLHKYPITACEAVLRGTTESGGLWVPSHIPKLDVNLEGASFEEVMYAVLDNFGFISEYNNSINSDDAKNLIKKAYKNFHHKDKLDLEKFDENSFLLNLHYGPTGAFKDYALALVGQVIPYLLKQQGKKGVVVGATSGDTGPAAMANVANENLFVNILYPNGGTSDGQEKQMIHFSGDIAQAYAMEKSSFDDCQDLVKDVFSDHEFLNEMEAAGKQLISINSINWLRIVGQVGYIIYSMLKFSDSNKIPNLIIPSGNSGHWVAAWIAKQMGVKIGDIILSTNDNKLLEEVVNTGEYYPRDVIPTIAPAMDISKSSNFERFLYFKFGSVKTANFMIDQKGSFKLTSEDHNILKNEVDSFSVNEEDIVKSIRYAYNEKCIIIDPHTATGFSHRINTNIPNNSCYVYFSTAHPMKFLDIVVSSITESNENQIYLKECILESLPDEVSSVLDMSLDDMNKKRKIVKFDLDSLKQVLLKS